MDNTVNETWIDKLVDELVDTKNEVASNAVTIYQLNTLITLIFNNARLAYNGEGLRIDNEESIFEYLKIIEPDLFYRKLKYLKDERDVALAMSRHDAEVKAKETKGKKEA